MVRKILNRRARRDLREDRRALVRWFDRRNCDKAHETLADPLAAWEARSADIKLETAEYEHADKNERKTFKPSNPLCTDTCPIILHANSLNFPSHRQSFPVEAVAASMHPRKLFLRSQSCVQLSGTNALASFVDKTAFSGLISPWVTAQIGAWSICFRNPAVRPYTAWPGDSRTGLGISDRRTE
jgi:hypothetical protein